MIMLLPEDGRTWDEMTDEEIIELYAAAGMAGYGRIVVDLVRHDRDLELPVD